jgi:hypothetical protein
MDKSEFFPRNEKALQGFQNLKEIKLTNTRLILYPEKRDQPDEIVGILMRRYLEDLANKFK